MDIYVPYVLGKQGLRREVAELLQGRATFINLTGADDNYFRALAMIWSKGRDFCIVEQDILPTDDDLEGLATCPEDWCCCTYPYFKGKQMTIGMGCLGCTKFSAKLTKETPDLFRIIAGYSPYTMSFPPTHWVHLDSLTSNTLRNKYGKKEHAHGEVKHLRDFSPIPRLV